MLEVLKYSSNLVPLFPDGCLNKSKLTHFKRIVQLILALNILRLKHKSTCYKLWDTFLSMFSFWKPYKLIDKKNVKCNKIFFVAELYRKIKHQVGVKTFESLRTSFSLKQEKIFTHYVIIKKKHSFDVGSTSTCGMCW